MALPAESVAVSQSHRSGFSVCYGYAAFMDWEQCAAIDRTLGKVSGALGFSTLPAFRLPSWVRPVAAGGASQPARL